MKRPLRVLLLAASRGGTYSGADLSLAHLLRAVVEASPGIEPVVVVPSSSPTERMFGELGIAIRPSSKPTCLLRPRHWREFVGSAWYLSSLARDVGADLIHGNAWHHVDTLGFIGLINGLPTVGHLRDAAPALHQGTLRQPQRRFLARRVRRFVGITHYVVRGWRECWPGARFTMINTGFVLRATAPAMPAPGKVCRFLVVANVTPVKNLEVLPGFLAAWPTSWTLTVCGHRATVGPDAEYFANLNAAFARDGLSDKVTWRSFANLGPEVLFRDHDVLLHPCRQEAFGRVAIEAIDQGLLVVGPTVGGLAEVLGTDELGLRVDFTRPREAVAKIMPMWADTARCTNFRRQAWERARLRFSMDRPVKRITDLYALLTGRQNVD